MSHSKQSRAASRSPCAWAVGRSLTSASRAPSTSQSRLATGRGALGGRLVMRSGTGELVTGPGGSRATNDCTPLPGTLLEIELPVQTS